MKQPPEMNEDTDSPEETKKPAEDVDLVDGDDFDHEEDEEADNTRKGPLARLLKRTPSRGRKQSKPQRRSLVRRIMGRLFRTIRKIRLSMVIAVASALFTAYWIWGGEFTINEAYTAVSVSESEEANEANEAPLRKVRYLVAVRENYPITATLTGRTAPSRTLVLRSETSGAVIARNGERGDYFVAGTTVAQIDKGTLEFQLKQAEEELALRATEHNNTIRLRKRGVATALEEQQALVARQAAITNLALINDQLAKTTISTPFAGFIQENYVEVGDIVSPGADIMQLVDLRPIFVVVNVSEQRIGSLQTGKRARITVLDGTTYSGSITAIAPQADAQTRTFEVEISLPNTRYQLRAGRTVEVEIVLRRESLVFIPQSTLTLNDESTLGVKLLTEQDTVAFTPVDIERDEQKGVWVDGIPNGARVITVGHELVSEDESVEPTLDTFITQ